MNEELKPCPFCGGTATVEEVTDCNTGNKGWEVSCDDCLGILYYWTGETKEKAIEAWNRWAADDS